jgi:heme exporter protein CcmD
MSPGEFFTMGGYAAFVWPSFGLVLFALVWNVVAARRLHAAARRDALRRSGAGARA